MNGLWKPFRKKSDPKNRENCKNQSEIAAHEQKTNSEKANFCSNTFFSIYFKIRAIKFHAAKPIWLPKIMKMCEQILKKDSAPIQFKFFEM